MKRPRLLKALRQAAYFTLIAVAAAAVLSLWTAAVYVGDMAVKRYHYHPRMLWRA